MRQWTLPKFWSRVEIPDERLCWPWRGEVDRRGYGRFKTVFAGAQIYHAHVFSLAMATQQAPDGRFAIHKCDNPPCVNPLHLRWGDHEEMRDTEASTGKSWAYLVQRAQRRWCVWGWERAMRRAQRKLQRYRQERAREQKREQKRWVVKDHMPRSDVSGNPLKSQVTPKGPSGISASPDGSR